jgi:hypothetical protein
MSASMSDIYPTDILPQMNTDVFLLSCVEKIQY